MSIIATKKGSNGLNQHRRDDRRTSRAVSYPSITSEADEPAKFLLLKEGDVALLDQTPTYLTPQPSDDSNFDLGFCIASVRTGHYLVHCCSPERTGHYCSQERTGHYLVHCCSPERTGHYLVHCCSPERTGHYLIHSCVPEGTRHPGPGFIRGC